MNMESIGNLPRKVGIVDNGLHDSNNPNADPRELNIHGKVNNWV